MFDETSRYKRLPTATFTDHLGQKHTYVTQRYLPDRSKLAIAASVPVLPGDRTDIVAHRVYGASEAYWRLADATEIAEPETLTDETGRYLKAPLITPDEGLDG